MKFPPSPHIQSWSIISGMHLSWAKKGTGSALTYVCREGCSSTLYSGGGGFSFWALQITAFFSQTPVPKISPFPRPRLRPKTLWCQAHWFQDSGSGNLWETLTTAGLMKATQHWFAGANHCWRPKNSEAKGTLQLVLTTKKQRGQRPENHIKPIIKPIGETHKTVKTKQFL